MIQRKALLIGAPDQDIPGVKLDIKNMKNFLLSSMGGAWRESEITCLTNPKKNEVEFAIKRLQDCDYSFILFAGHGFYSIKDQCTTLNINESETLSSKKLRFGAKKHTIILDCCRVLVNDLLLEMSLEAMTYDSAIKTLDLSECRRYFDKRITECDSGIVVINSCDVKETAGETSNKGGYYSSSLINVAKELVENKLITIDLKNKYKIFSINECHEKASILVKELSGNRQNPTFEGPRTKVKFPFAIVA